MRECVQECLRSMKQQRTTVTVAHRLSTIMDADLIVALDNGVISEAGSHEKLVANKGLYHSLWQRQLHSTSMDDLAAAVASPPTAATPPPPAERADLAAAVASPPTAATPPAES